MSLTAEQGRLLVHIAENGHSYELECNETTLVESIMRYTESVTGINFNDQQVLCMDMKLESQRQLSAYKLPDGDREIFIFNKARLQNTSPPPPPEEVDVFEVADPPLLASVHDPHPLDEARDPALKALPSYERQFRYHYQKSCAIQSITQLRFDNCERLLKEQKVQERAMEVARGNLDQYYKMINQNYGEFLKRYTHQHRIHSDLLKNFERDLDKLRSVKLHPSLRTNAHKFLADFVKEEGLRRVAENCSASHRQFEKKVCEFKLMFSEAKQKVEELFASKISVSVRNLELTVKDHHRFINEQMSIMQSLSKDVNTVKKLVDDCLSCQLSSSLRPHDAVSALGPMYEVHDKTHLPKMQACGRSISKLLEFCLEKKNEMNVFFHTYMQKIAYVSYVIKDAKMQFPVFKEAMVRQDEHFAELRLVRGVGPAYRACLAEVVRRRASMKLYMGMAGQLAERLAVKREAELGRREEFLKAHSCYIPRDVLASMGLYDSPNQCDVNIAPFDDNLLDLDISDVDRFAPEFLLSLPVLGLPEVSAKNNDDVVCKSELEELLDDCELVEIAGTSGMEVENAKLKAELASVIAFVCSICPDIEYEQQDDGEVEKLLRDVAEKTAEALQRKDEYQKSLLSVLKAKQAQCVSYEKRIEEVERRLCDQYAREKKMSDSKQADPMDEVSCVSSTFDLKAAMFVRQRSKGREAADENMLDASGMFGELHLADGSRKDKVAEQLNMSLTCSSVAESTHVPLDGGLAEKSKLLDECECKLKAAMEETALLTKELELARKLLDESQMNCAHLEKCLHDAREEAQTHLCAADRRASEYSALRASAVRMRGLFERLRSCIYSPGGVASFADSLRALAHSFTNSMDDGEDDGNAEFRKCIRVLADKVGFLSRHREELLEKYPKLQSMHEKLVKEFEENKELVTTLRKKLQLAKQTSKEKISFHRLQVHEIAAFVLNASGHYEAINQAGSHFYLSAESVALFTEHLQSRPSHIVGQIVHLERQVAKLLPPSQTRLDVDESDQVDHPMSGTRPDPYGLPVGCEYFVVTIAMLPDAPIAA